MPSTVHRDRPRPGDRTGDEDAGGGTFQSIPVNREGISVANDAGQHAFLAILADGVDGRLIRWTRTARSRPSLSSGDTTDRGSITSVGQGHGKSMGIGLNNKGQVALVVQIAGDPDTLVLLTSTAP